MNLEEMTANELKKQIEDEEKKMKELRGQLLAKRIAVKALEKQARKNEVARPSKFFNKMIANCTSYFAGVHGRAKLAVEDPEGSVAVAMLDEANKLLLKATAIEDNSHKNAQKICLQCAAMVCRVESAIEQLKANELYMKALGLVADNLNNQVQRLRTTPKANIKDVIKKLHDVTDGNIHKADELAKKAEELCLVQQ